MTRSRVTKIRVCSVWTCTFQTHETKRADLGRESSIRTWFTTGGSQVDDFDFIGILESGRISPGYGSNQTKMPTNFGAIATRESVSDQDLMRKSGKRSCGLGMSCTAGGSHVGNGKSRDLERADQEPWGEATARSFSTEMC